jgi:hypothetical protein
MLRAARLFAAAQELRQSLNISPIVFWRRSRTRLLEAARGVVEGNEYDQARQEGRAMTLEQALEYALTDRGQR